MNPNNPVLRIHQNVWYAVTPELRAAALAHYFVILSLW